MCFICTSLFAIQRGIFASQRVFFHQIIFCPVQRNISNETKNFIWIGWGMMVASGILLIYLKDEIDNLMIIKLFFVALIGINGIFLHKIHGQVDGYKKGDHVPNKVMFRLFLALFVSQLAWWSAFIIGFLHRHIQSVINWPPFPFLVWFLIASALVIIWKIGEWIIRITSL